MLFGAYRSNKYIDIIVSLIVSMITKSELKVLENLENRIKEGFFPFGPFPLKNR
jgi:hypothetical protein